MANKFKYMRRVFSGKEVPVIGLDQGKSSLYRGDGVQSMFNGYYDSSLNFREGQVQDAIYEGGINSGGAFHTAKFVGEGTNLWAELI